jgi:hypothetical protein
VKLLFINPGKLINEYLDGRTKDYYNPLKYLLIIAGISALLVIWFNVFDANMENTKHLFGVDEPETKLQSSINDYIKKYLNLFTILVLPFYSLISKWVFKKHKQYYAEHLIINSYLFAQYTLIQIFTLFTLYFFPFLTKFIFVFGFVVFISYYSYAFKSIYKIKFWKSLLSSISIFVLGMLSFLFFIIMLTIIVMLTLKFSGVSLKELVM